MCFILRLPNICVNSRSLQGESVLSGSHPDVSTHETEHGYHSSVDNLSFVAVFQALILPQAASLSHIKRIKEKRSTEHKRPAGCWGQRSAAPLWWAQQSAGGAGSDTTMVLIRESGLHCAGTLPTECVCGPPEMLINGDGKLQVYTSKGSSHFWTT